MSIETNQPVDLDAEEGSVLIMALIMITVIGAMLAAILSFTDTSLVATPTFVAHRDAYNDVDGAVDAAINSVRGSNTLGTAGKPCPAFTPPAASGHQTVTVLCQPQPGSGVNNLDQPTYAVLTLGSGPNDGFIEAGNNTLTVDGGLYTNGKLDLTTNGSQNALQVYGDVLAQGSCLSTSSSSLTSLGGLVKCNYSGDASGTDPMYPPSLADTSSFAASAIDPSPSCSGNSVVTFSPGLYTEIPSASGCSGSTWWFSPGRYYFDFPAARSDWAPASLSGSTVVGGTLDPVKYPAGAATNSSAVTIPGACDATKPGVQFIFGGPSRLSLAQNGLVELCGSTSQSAGPNWPTGRQNIALFALGDTMAQNNQPPAGTVNTTATRSSTPATLQETGALVTPSQDTQGFADVIPPLLGQKPAGQLVDSRWTAATLVSPGSYKVADVGLSSFGTVPKGAKVTSVIARVRHYESDPALAGTLYVSIPATPDKSARTITPSDSTGSSLKDWTLADCSAAVNPCTNTVDITSEFTGVYGYAALNGISARYEASLTGNLTAVDNLDGVEFQVTYLPVGFEKSACPASAPGCSVVLSTVQNNLFFHGTVYTPNALLTVIVLNNGVTVFDRGVISRSLVVTASASSKQTDSPFRIPRGTTGREVLFVGQINGVDKVRTLVAFQDFVTVSGTTVAYPGYRVAVERWSVVR
jgi:hypothetical protein